MVAVDIDDGARLRDGTDVQHGLVFGSDGGCVGEDEDCFMCKCWGLVNRRPTCILLILCSCTGYVEVARGMDGGW